jgi:hypothetical protein
MQRRRSVPHAFDETIAAEKAKLEAQLTTLKPAPHQVDVLRRKIRQLETASHIERLAAVARPNIARMSEEQRFGDACHALKQRAG